MTEPTALHDPIAAEAHAATARPAAVAVVVPTFNEAPNIGPLVDRLERVLAGRQWEVVFVDDDSADGTAAVVQALARDNPRVRCLLRLDRRGLSRAVIEGILSTSAPLVAVMDADLQHDEAILPRLLEVLDAGQADVAVGSRYTEGGGVGAGFGAQREAMSRFATWLAGTVLRVRLRDPMSGFFALRRDLFDGVMRRLSGEGYKILLDILASAREPLRVTEVPYQFRPRVAGESKLDSAVAWEYALLLIDKRIGRWVPVRFVMFALVGASGVLVHLAVLWALFRGMGEKFAAAQTIATLVAMTSNYALNNVFTYRDRRHRGLGWVWGLLTFYAICGLGVIANVGVASALFDRSNEAWLLAALAGALVGTVWNYGASRVVTWRRA
ncbi:glycosyltransferase family 2 protein [Caenimonas sedimenti]|uniref:Glycosyltransferase family 2 protein n=1 Tax=Caenimonas sedimenti TaxID=2596921 RepID=A0A562ZLG0_9BURK|nr:glycosyltransferase family 2 protein [Caenimonas sedimenti]TWO69014.1 glycosyltransferase family 2 protein [Caenimonas sedimenti]